MVAGRSVELFAHELVDKSIARMVKDQESEGAASKREVSADEGPSGGSLDANEGEGAASKRELSASEGASSKSLSAAAMYVMRPR